MASIFHTKTTSNFQFTTDLKCKLGNGRLHMKDTEERKASIRQQILQKIVQQLTKSRLFQMLNHLTP